MKVYLMPGLGLDSAIFSYLQLSNYDCTYMYWIEPEIKESLSNYVRRLIAHFNITKESVLIGHSFGGIVIQEISKYLEVDKLILISTVINEAEIPRRIRTLKLLPIHRGLNKTILKDSFILWNKFHDYKGEAKKQLFYQGIEKYSSHYFIWAVDQIIQWKSEKIKVPFCRIHGSLDDTFPRRNIKNENIHFIDDGAHLMLVSHHKPISKIIESFIM